VSKINRTPIKYWIQAARLRTLPLAFAVIILGSGLAYLHRSTFTLHVFLWALIVSFSYQVLSNYANDLGDGIKGTDKNKKGEQRAVASGLISVLHMKRATGLFTILALVSGALLTYLSFWNSPLFWLFQLLNIGAVWAARSYTLGSSPYAYWGGGDLFVFLFFGFVGVMGSSALQTGSIMLLDALPSVVAGSLSASVLTLNNLRDREGDELHNKKTLVVRYGSAWGRAYFKALLIVAIISSLSFALIATVQSNNYYPLVAHLIFQFVLRGQFKKFSTSKSSEEYDSLLKPMALVTLMYCVLTSLSLFLP
jgi:1,4-dihydroxy-2-naphthoate octaprenyltransferase